MKKYIYDVHLSATITLAARDEQQAIALAKEVMRTSGASLSYAIGVYKRQWSEVYEPTPKPVEPAVDPDPEPGAVLKDHDC